MKKYYLLIFALLGVTFLPAQVLLDEDFNNGLPATWTVINGGDGPDTWERTIIGARNGNFLDGTEFMFVDSDASPQADTLSEILLTPVFNTTTLSSLVLEFDHHHLVFGGEIAFLEVYNGSNWVILDSFPTTEGAFNTPVHETYNVIGLSNTNFQVRFRYEDNGIWGWYWGVDNVELYSPFPLDAEIVSLANPIRSCTLGNETIDISFTNSGTSTIQSLDLVYVLNAGTPVTQTYATAIPSGNTVSFSFSIPANLSSAGQHTLEIYTNLTGDNNRNNDTLSGIVLERFTPVSTFPYREDFESGQGGWSDKGTNTSWAFGTPVKDVILGANSGVNAWVTGGLGTGDYNNNESSWIESPCFDLSGLTNPWIQFYIWWNAESSWDGATLQASTDLGGNWQTIGAFGDPNNWYTDNTINANPGGQQEGWTGRNSSNDGSGTWVPASHDLAAVAGQQEVLLRIIFATDGTVTDDGVAIDDILLANGPAIGLGPDTVACDSFPLDPGGPYANYLWSTGDTTQTLNVTTTGIYEVIVTDSNGFITTDEITLVIETLNDLDLGPDTSLCDDSTYMMDAGMGGNSYLWNTGATTNTLTATTSGTYFVTVSYGLGCLQIDDVIVNIVDLQPGYTVSDTQICRNLPITFTDTTSGSTSWLWDFGDGTTSTLPALAHTYTSGGTFLLKLVVEAGACRDSISEVYPVLACDVARASDMDHHIHIVPNPNSGDFQLQWKGITGTQLQMRMMDLRGLTVWENTAQNSSTGVLPLHLPMLSKGIYFMEISTEKGRWTQKVHIE